jgi:hypothetical protein
MVDRVAGIIGCVGRIGWGGASRIVLVERDLTMIRYRLALLIRNRISFWVTGPLSRPFSVASVPLLGRLAFLVDFHGFDVGSASVPLSASK